MVKIETDLKLKEDIISKLRKDLARHKGSDSMSLLDYKNKLHDANDRIRTLVADKEVSDAMFIKFNNVIAVLKDDVKALKSENMRLNSKLCDL